MYMLNIQGDSYSIIQTLTGGRIQPLDTLTKMCQFLMYESKFYCQEPFETGICRWLQYL
jgi:hypothetical protein